MECYYLVSDWVSVATASPERLIRASVTSSEPESYVLHSVIGIFSIG